jgi:glycosyltransferase involved in cell wall biosynthesis
VRGLAAGLLRRGWRVGVVVSEPGPLCGDLESLGARVYVLRRVHPLLYLVRLAALLRRLCPDVVHAHSARLACLAARLAGIAAVVETRHGLPERLHPIYRALPRARMWEAVKCGSAAAVITVCASDARWLAEAGLSAGRIRVVPNGIEPEPGTPSASPAQWRLPSGKRLAGFVGRLCPQKAPQRFLELLALLLRADARIHGVICGEGSERERLESRARTLGLSPNLTWLGSLEDAGILPAALDLLVLPSLWEGAPYVLLEALRAGTPVLATPVGGIPEILQGPALSRGCCPWDPQEWSRRALSFLAGKDPAFQAAARERASFYREEDTVARVEGIYRELIGTPV